MRANSFGFLDSDVNWALLASETSVVKHVQLVAREATRALIHSPLASLALVRASVASPCLRVIYEIVLRATLSACALIEIVSRLASSASVY